MIKYQVFISSTYLDLIEERQAAVQAILGRHNIPAGMELFSAGNESQLKVIKEWIKDSDIYMLLLGGRYGSIDPKSGLSYTEIEYRYALKVKKPVFALIIDDTFLKEKADKIGPNKVIEQNSILQYEAFKKALLSSRICRRFKNLDELKLETVYSLDDIINSSRYKLQGWTKVDIQSDQKASIFSHNVFSYGVMISNPQIGIKLTNPVYISGTFQKLPPGKMFYGIEFNPRLRTYWPKNEILFDNGTKTWSSVMGMGQGDDRDRVMLVVAVGKQGLQIIKEFYEAPDRGLIKLTDDMIIVDQVRITLKKE